MVIVHVHGPLSLGEWDVYLYSLSNFLCQFVTFILYSFIHVCSQLINPYLL